MEDVILGNRVGFESLGFNSNFFMYSRCDLGQVTEVLSTSLSVSPPLIEDENNSIISHGNGED